MSTVIWEGIALIMLVDAAVSVQLEKPETIVTKVNKFCVMYTVLILELS